MHKKSNFQFLISNFQRQYRFVFLFLILLFSLLIGGTPLAYAGQVGVSSQPPAATTTATGLNRGLVGYWTMDGKDINWTSATAGTIIDRSGNGNTGTISGMIKTWSPILGKVGQALRFTSGNVTVTDSLNDMDNVTISMWVNLSNWNDSIHNPIITTASIGNAGHISFYRRNNNSMWFQLVDADGTIRRVDKDVSGLRGWHYLTVVFSKTAAVSGTHWMEMYIDTSKVGNSYTAADAAWTANVDTNFLIGQDGSGFHIKGSLDDIRVYNRVLSATEIQQLYKQGTPAVNASAPSTSRSGQATSATSTATGLNRGLVGYWTMDGKDINWANNTMIDRSGNGKTGTLVGLGKATSTVAGKVGQGMKFDGVGSYTSHSATAFAAGSSWTYSSWLKWDGTNSDGNQMSPYGALAVANTYLTIRYNATNQFCIRNTSFACGSISSTPYYRTGWHLITWVSNGSTIKVYADGIYKDIISPADTHMTFSGIGKGYSASNILNFNGSIDDVRIYDRALSAAEIGQLYKQGTPAVNSSPKSTAPTGVATSATSTATGLNRGLVGYWTMDGKDINWTTNAMIDRSGNGNTGTLVGMAKATSTASGKVGQAMKFDGVAACVLSTNSRIYLGTGSSLSVWFKKRVVNAGSGSFIAAATNNDLTKRLSIGLTNNTTVSGSFYDSSFHVGGGGTANDTNWHHAVVVWDGTNAYFYLDNMSKTGGSSVPTAPGANYVNIACRDAAPDDRFFDGSIDDVRIYNRALSSAEIGQLYNMGR